MTELCHTGRGLSEEFDDDFQNRLAAYFCRDHEFLTRAGDLVAPNQFSNAANSILVNMVSGYYRMYKSAPSSSAKCDSSNALWTSSKKEGVGKHSPRLSPEENKFLFCQNHKRKNT